MNVTSLEISKRLFELSDWEGTDHAWAYQTSKSELVHLEAGYTVGENWDYAPAYDLGYLLRKLPAVIEGSRFLTLSHPDVALDGTGWVAGYTTGIDDVIKGKVNFRHDTVADTPEDAAGLLAIKLFEEGVLK